MTEALIDRLQYELFKLEIYGAGSPLVLSHIQDLHRGRDARLHEEIKQALADRCYGTGDWATYNDFMEM